MRFHWWEAMRHQPKWRAKSAGSSITNSWISSSDRGIEDEVTRPLDRDRAKTTTRKRKEKEGSSKQSEPSSTIGGMIFTLKRLITSFDKTQVWKQWNKLKDCSTINMDDEELKIHREAIQLIQRDLQFVQANEVVVENEDNE
jgi:hypothetical protein